MASAQQSGFLAGRAAAGVGVITPRGRPAPPPLPALPAGRNAARGPEGKRRTCELTERDTGPRAAMAAVGPSLGLAWLGWLGLLGWLGCAGQPLQPRPAVAADGSAPIAATALFDFAGHAWVSLHHFLYEWAVADEAAGKGPAAGRRPVAVPERAALAELSAGGRGAWLAAVGHYRREIIARPRGVASGLVQLPAPLAGRPPP